MQKIYHIKNRPEELLILNGLLVLLCLAPLPLGSNRPLPVAIIITFVGAVCAYWGYLAFHNKEFIRISAQHVRKPLLLLAPVFIWILVQMLPLGTNYFWENAQLLLPAAGIWSSISVTPGSWAEFCRLLAYLGLFWVTLQLSRSTGNADKILKFIAYSGVAYAAYGLLVELSGAQKILWMDKYAYMNSLTSTFINRNNYATYAGITLIASLSLLINQVTENTGKLKKRDFYNVIIRRCFTSSMPYLAMVIIIASALLLTDSRAGIICSAIGFTSFIVFRLLAARKKKQRLVFAGIAAFVLFILLLLFNAGGDEVTERFSGIQGHAAYRTAIYGGTIAAISDFPLQGTGLGSFTDIFTVYRDDSLPGWFNTITDHAHNTYLEFALELGIPATILLIAAIAMVWGRCIYGAVSRKQNAHIPAVSASSGLIIATHALFDFSVEIPAVSIVFTILMAVGVAQSWSKKINISETSGDIPPAPVYYKIAPRAALGIGLLLVISGLWQAGSFFAGSPFSAETLRYKGLENIELARSKGILTPEGSQALQAAQIDLEKSLNKAPANAYAWTYLSYSSLLGGDKISARKFLSASITNSFYNPSLLFFRLGLIPVLWSQAEDDEKLMMANQVKLAWRWDRKRTASIMSNPIALGILKAQLSLLPEPEKELSILEKLQKK